MTTNQITEQAVVTSQSAPVNTRAATKLALFDADGNPWAGATAAEIVLSGYVIGSAAALTDTDTLNEALGKLEARIVALEP